MNISFSNILLYLVNIHLLTMSEIYYSQLSEYFLAYFYPHLGPHYHLYSILHNQEHLYPHSSIPLLSD